MSKSTTNSTQRAARFGMVLTVAILVVGGFIAMTQQADGFKATVPVLICVLAALVAIDATAGRRARRE